ncbi:MAG: DUF4160 domain-containing protein [Proteobacteria bacterium]|nr:DUF4160 domain-containing protein [Pseudomonadota bacterium]
MPNVFTINGFRVFFYSADGNEPIHVHVEYGDGLAKFWMNPVALSFSYKMKGKDLKRIRLLLEEHSDLVKEQWNEYFGHKN